MKGSLALAALLAGAGVFHHFLLREPGRARPGLEDVRIAQQRSAIEHCRQSAHMIFDVHWAAACMAEANESSGAGDGHAECDLPDAKAAAVNAWLDEAEARCVAEVQPASN